MSERALLRGPVFAVRELIAVILAGGLGTRLSEETDLKPKPMVEIGGRPILWHIMKIYSHFGVNDFVVCCGYKGYAIKEYFQNYAIHMSDATFDLGSGLINVHKKRAEDWRVTLVDTGETSMTGGRLKRVREYLDPGETFFFTYGDGVADVDIGKSLKFHKAGQALATMTTVRPPGRFGATLVNSDGYIEAFAEKRRGGCGTNGSLFVKRKTSASDGAQWFQGLVAQYLAARAWRNRWGVFIASRPGFQPVHKAKLASKY